MPYLGITVRRVGRLLFSEKKKQTNKQKTKGNEKKGSIYALYFHCQKHTLSSLHFSGYFNLENKVLY